MFAWVNEVWLWKKTFAFASARAGRPQEALFVRVRHLGSKLTLCETLEG